MPPSGIRRNSAGVDGRQQVTVQSIAGTGPFQIVTTAGEFEGKSLVNASGRWSNLKIPPSPGNHEGIHEVARNEKWLGIKAHFAEEVTDLRSTAPSVDLYFFNGGYCGVQPVQVRGEKSVRRVNASAMVRADVATNLEEVLARHPVLQERSRGWTSLSDPVSTSPLIFRDPQPEYERVLMAGDAAGFVDPFVGDGISLALRSGALAASCLGPFFAGKTSLSEAATNYRQRYGQTLLPVFRASSKIRQMLKFPQAIRKPLLMVLEKTPAITRYAVRKTR